MIVFNESSHLPFLEEQEKFEEVVTEFLEKIEKKELSQKSDGNISI
jgi:hypothetical protein